MSHSEVLRFSEVREVFRLVGDVRDLCHDQPAQETRIVDGLCELIGAPLGWASTFGAFRPGAATRVEQFTPGTVRDETVLKCLEDWQKISDFADDPMVDLGRPSTEASDVVCRSQRLTLRDWQGYAIYGGVIDPAGVADTMAMWFRYPGGDRIRGYALFRMKGDRVFSPKQVGMARLFVEELGFLYVQGKLEPPDVLDELPARLRRLVPLLLTGLGQKQIAAKTGLSYHTVRSYVKELYDILEVSSREELGVKVRGETPSRMESA